MKHLWIRLDRYRQEQVKWLCDATGCVPSELVFNLLDNATDSFNKAIRRERLAKINAEAADDGRVDGEQVPTD